jgi:hypothetical protein
MKVNKFFFLLLFAGVAQAQMTTAKLGPVAKDTLYRIFLPSEFISYSDNSNSFRIFDHQGNEVPYKAADPNIVYDGFQSKFHTYHIVSKTVVAGKSTSVIVENPAGEITDLTLQIANAEVTKKFSISGSDDLQHWYGLVNNRELSEITNDASTDNFKIIFFPRNKYRYIRFDIDDKKTLPLNILSAGNIEILHTQHRTEILKPAKLTTQQLKPQKLTLIHVRFNRLQVINRFRFHITAPNYYKRSVRIYKNVHYKFRKKVKTRQELIDTFYIDSANKNFLYNAFAEQDFFMEIDNRDNPPLAISNIEFVHELSSVIADLKANEDYTIKAGNPNWKTPDYDAPFPAPKTFENYPEAKITQIKHADATATITKETAIWQKSWFMWLCISIGAAAIIYFAFSLVKDMKGTDL